MVRKKKKWTGNQCFHLSCSAGATAGKLVFSVVPPLSHRSSSRSRRLEIPKRRKDSLFIYYVIYISIYLCIYLSIYIYIYIGIYGCFCVLFPLLLLVALRALARERHSARVPLHDQSFRNIKASTSVDRRILRSPEFSNNGFRGFKIVYNVWSGS